MRLTPLEAEVIRRLLDEPTFAPVARAFDPERVVVEDRAFTGVGFLTDLTRSAATRLFQEDFSARWTPLEGRLGGETDVGFLVYVDDSWVTGIEGYTYGDDWPEGSMDVVLTPRAPAASAMGIGEAPR